MEKLETRQEFVNGAFAGLVAGIFMFVFVEAFRWAGLTTFGISYLASGTVFDDTGGLGIAVLSFLIHCGIGAFWGILVSFLFSKVLSSDYYIVKSIFISFCIYLFSLGLLDDPFNYHKEIHKHTLDLLILLGGYVIYGVILAIVLKKREIIEE